MALLQRVIKPAVKRQIYWLLGMVLMTALLAYLVYGLASALATLYGGVVVLASTAILAWRMCSSHEPGGAHTQLGQFYRTSLERLVLVCVMMAAGLGPLELPPIYLLGGFLVAMVAQVVITVLIWKRAI